MTTILSFDVGIFNLAFTNVTVNEITETTENKEKALNTVINDWGILSLKSRDDPKKMDLNVLSRNLIVLLNEKFGDVDFQTVLIENQPCMKNPTMKSIQMILYTFFVMHSYLEGKTIDIKFVSASNKLKVKHKADVSHITTKAKYMQNKKYVVEYARNYLQLSKELNLKWIDLFEKEKKKDDWADAYCQALHFIENNM
jgi:hypothetical protein